jgi:hypothetical protein
MKPVFVKYYVGKSMEGVFQFGDMLHIQPEALENVDVGDIVAYKHLDLQGNEVESVHRVIKKSEYGLTVLGDNNYFEDSTFVNNHNFLGRILYFKRAGKTLYPKKNYFIRFKLTLLRYNHLLLHKICNICHSFIRYPYLFIRNTGFMKSAWKPNIQKQVYFPNGKPLIKYTYKGVKVASFDASTNKMYCKKPFDLFILDTLKSKHNIFSE